MRRWLATAALALLAGCAQRALPLPISIVGLDSMTKVHFNPDPVFLADGGQDLLFMTSSDHSELRVLNLDPNLSPRDFIRAPNPIEPLAIPVLPEPVALAHDTTWDANGTEVAGPYVYARAAAGSEISVVTDAPNALVEYCRMELSGTVTAMAARAPELLRGSGDGGLNSLLYFATWDDTTAHLYEVTMPRPGVLARYPIPGGDHIDCWDGSDAGFAVSGTPYTTQRLLDLPGESIVALLVLPGLPGPVTADGGPVMLPDGGTFDVTQPGLVVATHLGSSGGRTFHLLTGGTGLTSRALGFPGPVKSLLTIERAPDPNGNTVTVVAAVDGGQINLDPGSRVLASLDEGACADYPTCSGMLSVDVATAQLSYDGTMDRNGNFQTMLTLGSGNGLVTGTAIASETSVEIPPAGGAVTLSQLGMYSDSTGSVFFFNGVTLQPINASIVGPDVVRDSSGTPVIILTSSDGGSLVIAPGTGPDPSSIDAGLGAANSETIYLLFQGQVPGLTNLPRDPDGGVDLNLPSGAPQVLLGDGVVFNSSLDANCDGGAAVAPVVNVSRMPSAIEVDGGPPAACPQWTTFTVRAGPAAPFVVGGTTSGFIGRVAPGGTVIEWGTPYFHAEPTLTNPDGGSNIATPRDQQPALAFTLLAGSDPAWTQDDAFTFSLVNNYAPMYLQIDARLGAGFQLPAALAIDPVLQLAYIAYPAANGVIEFAPSAITPNVPNYLNLQPYR